MRLWEIPDQIQGFLDSNFYSVTGMLILKRGESRIRGPRYDGRISKVLVDGHVMKQMP